jgi:cell wall-associated NlpC family hydrolase
VDRRLGGRLGAGDGEGAALTRRLVSALTGTVTATVLAASTLLAAPAVAEPAPSLEDLRGQAAALQQQVERLETAVEVAAEEHAEATEELSTSIAAELSAESALADARHDGARERREAGSRARAVYMAGGQFGLVAGVLSGDDPGDVLDRYRTVQVLVRADADETVAATSAVDEAVSASGRLQALRAQRQSLESRAARAAADAEAALAQHRALLAETDARVVALAEQERRRQEEAALAAATAAATAVGVVPDVAAPSDAAARAVAAARSMLGTPYQWGAVGPDRFDCSGLTSWAYRQAGIAIPRTSRAQYAALPKVPVAAMAPGDLVFYASGSDPGSIHHVGIYAGDGVMIHAPRTGDVVKVSAVSPSAVYGVVRPTARS